MTSKDAPTDQITAFWKAFDIGHVKRSLRLIISYILVTFGQAAYSPFIAKVASVAGFSFLFYELTKHRAKRRFLFGFCFFFLVQCVELFWFTYHPVVAARSTFLLLSALMGLQFGIVCLFVSKEILTSRFSFLIIPSLWTLLEWSRFSWCSGFYFDLTGMQLAANLVTLQSASLFGLFGMTFWVLLTNVLLVRAYLLKNISSWFIACTIALIPYLYGNWHLNFHKKEEAIYNLTHKPLGALIVHSKKVPEEFKPLPRPHLTPQMRALYAWKELIFAISPFFQKEKPDLILMPEGVVPYGSNTLLFKTDEVNDLFLQAFGVPIAPTFETELTSEDIAKEVVRLFNCPLIIGLEGIKRVANSSRPLYYNSAFFFSNDLLLPPERYDKQVLVPMGEYIPCNFAKKWAAKYGIYDSFTPGKSAKPFHYQGHKIGASVCYEETVGSLMRQNSVKGATLLVNLTDDYWFPYSMLAVQHFEHARPRTVENGVPLIRSCNFGISGVVDSLGREVLIKEGEETPSAFLVSFSSYHYSTLYGKWGDLPILLLSSFFFLLGISLVIKKSYNK